MGRPRLTDEEREKRRIRRALTRDFFMEGVRRELAREERALKRRGIEEIKARQALQK